MQEGVNMFNMENIGRTIAELRKERNMTQLELADKMGISFQAVSNWERGNSMPDISKLPELAELFDVTIDQLLGEHSEIIESAAKGDIKECFENNTATIGEIKSIAPLLKPHQVEEIVESEKFADLKEIEDLLPFVGKDVINKIARERADNREYHKLDSVMPFASRNVIDDIARKMISEGKNIADIAPFVSRNILSELAENLYTQKGVKALEDIAPFIPSDQLVQIAEMEYQKNGMRHLDSIAPFLNRKYLNELARKAIQKDGIKAISNIAPFLDKGMLAEYVKEKYL
ncbi:MAG: helix-turn-helix domain-containing protein [Lachnospiraceae bacterium]|nr:helix-turn-helix domain-containing protein [Lachnospiraceae bacterium]